MCRSMADIQSTAAEIRREKKEDRRRRKKLQGKNIQILTGEDGPLKLNLLIKLQILMVKISQFTTKCNTNIVIALKWQISLW